MDLLISISKAFNLSIILSKDNQVPDAITSISHAARFINKGPGGMRSLVESPAGIAQGAHRIKHGPRHAIRFL